MTKAAYAAYLRSFRWRRIIRPVRLWLDGYRCQTCHKRHGLEIHHASYADLGSWQIWAEVADTITLRDSCHDGIHSKQSIREFVD